MRKWIIGVLLIWGIFGVVNVYLKDWQPLIAIATWVLALGIFFAILQIMETKRSTNAQLAVELFRELRSEESRNTLRLIYRLRPEDIQRLHTNTNIGIENLKNEINSLLDKFEMLGSLVNHSIIEKSLAIEAFGGAPALRCWYCLAEYIRKEERCKRGFFLQNYEAFTRLCLDYFDKEQVRVKFYEEDSSDAPTDLIRFFAELGKGDERYPRSLKEIKRNRKNTARAEKNKKQDKEKNKKKNTECMKREV